MTNPRPTSNTATNKDNSWGCGYYPLPSKLAHLERFCSAFNKVEDHKAFPARGEEGEVHMLTVKVDTTFSIMVADMSSLIACGLVRMQCNNPGLMSFYFRKD